MESCCGNTNGMTYFKEEMFDFKLLTVVPTAAMWIGAITVGVIIGIMWGLIELRSERKKISKTRSFE
jgi:hypothetical protein